MTGSYFVHGVTGDHGDDHTETRRPTEIQMARQAADCEAEWPVRAALRAVRWSEIRKPKPVGLKSCLCLRISDHL